jgi:predicted Zn-dependent protease
MGFAGRLGLNRYEADEYYKKALDAYTKHSFDEAVLNLNEALKLLPNNSEYLAMRGFVKLEDDLEKEAEEDFALALKHFAFEMLAHYGCGIIAFKNKKWDEAQQHFTQAYRADAKRPETMYYLALVHHRKGEQAIALKVMQQALELFNANNDKRKSDAQKWVRTLEKLAAQSSLLSGGEGSST